MNKILLLLTTLVLSFSILLTGCGNYFPDDNEPTTNEPATEGTDAIDVDTESNSNSDIEAANLKLAAYIDCINNHSSRALDSYDRYLMWVDEETGPTGEEQNIYGLYPLTLEVKECSDAITVAVAMEPSYAALDEAALVYAKALSDLEPLINEANEYYEEKNYLDDGMAKGKELHPMLIAAFKAFESADMTMRSELEKITDELDVKELAVLEEKEGRTYPYLTKHVLILAKKIVDEGSVAADQLAGIDLESFQENITAYEAAVDELKAYDAAHKGELGPGLGASTLFIPAAENYLLTAKELMRRIRDNVPYDSGEIMFLNNGNGESVEGSPNKLIEEYNRLVDAYNSISAF